MRQMHPALDFTPCDSLQITPMSTFVQAERAAIMDALKAASGKIAGRGGAAERLGLKRTTLQNKMQKLGITRAASLTATPL
jgi:transcriptional regulator with GAF, ATPase, and Fis domain